MSTMLYTVCVIVLAVSPGVSYGLMVFVENTKLDELESFFSANTMVCDNKRYWWRNRARDRFKRTSLIVGFLFLPNLCVKRGYVTQAELAAVPLSLKRWALWPYLSGMVWFFSATAWCIWMKW